MYSDIQQQTLDIDWFFTNDENIGFVASGGGKLPNSVAKSSDNKELLDVFFRALPVSSKVAFNPNLSKHYLADFINMAGKGLFAFDKTVLNSFSDPRYHLVAWPGSPLKLADLPIEIRNIILETKINGEMGMILDITWIT